MYLLWFLNVFFERRSCFFNSFLNRFVYACVFVVVSFAFFCFKVAFYIVGLFSSGSFGFEYFVYFREFLRFGFYGD